MAGVGGREWFCEVRAGRPPPGRVYLVWQLLGQWGLHSINSDVKLCPLARRVESTSYGVHDLPIVAWRYDGPRRLLSAVLKLER